MTIQVSGWKETEFGVDMFDLEGSNMRSIAKQLKAIDPDAGGVYVYMEATDANGEDCTVRLYRSLNNLR